MKSIIERAHARKGERSAMIKKWNELHGKALNLQGGDKKERALREAEDTRKKIPESELQLETSKGILSTPLDRLLLRCCLVAQVVNKLEGGYDQLIQCGGLSLISSCIDIQIIESRRAAAVALRNAFMLLGSDGIIPSNFNDPAHVVRGLFASSVSTLKLFDDPQLSYLMTEMFGQLKAEPVWAPYFDQLPDFWKPLAQIVPPIHKGLSGRSADIQTVDPIASTVLTGKFLTCSRCSKLENKRGLFKKCSGCYDAVYCSRECQVADWKNGHKKECKKAAK